MRSRKITIVDLTERAMPFISCLDDGFTVCHLSSTEGGPGKVACIPGEAIQAMHSERRRNARLKSLGRFALGALAIAGSFYAGVAVARADPRAGAPGMPNGTGTGKVLDLTPHGARAPITAFIAAYDQVPWARKGEELLKSGAKVRRLCFPNGDRDGNFEETCFVFLEGGKAHGQQLALRMVVTPGMEDIREWCVIPQDNLRRRECLDQDSGEAFTYQVRKDGVWIDDNDEPDQAMAGE